jgi:hypothetical protein
MKTTVAIPFACFGLTSCTPSQLGPWWLARQIGARPAEPIALRRVIMNRLVSWNQSSQKILIVIPGNPAKAGATKNPEILWGRMAYALGWMPVFTGMTE